jgi:hypothetical protein
MTALFLKILPPVPSRSYGHVSGRLLFSPFLDCSQRLAVAFAAIFCLCLPGRAATPEGKTLEASKAPVQIAKAGKALVPIVISPESSESLKKTAAELAGYLKRITGAEFAIEQGREAKGITLGTLE